MNESTIKRVQEERTSLDIGGERVEVVAGVGVADVGGGSVGVELR